MKRLFTAAAMAAVLATGGASAEELRIGFINSLNHPIGKWQVNGFKLGLEHLGWQKNGDKINGVPVSVEYCDDQVRSSSSSRRSRSSPASSGRT